MAEIARGPVARDDRGEQRRVTLVQQLLDRVRRETVLRHMTDADVVEREERRFDGGVERMLAAVAAIPAQKIAHELTDLDVQWIALGPLRLRPRMRCSASRPRLTAARRPQEY